MQELPAMNTPGHRSTTNWPTLLKSATISFIPLTRSGCGHSKQLHDFVWSYYYLFQDTVTWWSQVDLCDQPSPWWGGRRYICMPGIAWLLKSPFRLIPTTRSELTAIILEFDTLSISRSHSIRKHPLLYCTNNGSASNVACWRVALLWFRSFPESSFSSNSSTAFTLPLEPGSYCNMLWIIWPWSRNHNPCSMVTWSKMTPYPSHSPT